MFADACSAAERKIEERRGPRVEITCKNNNGREYRITRSPVFVSVIGFRVWTKEKDREGWSGRGGKKKERSREGETRATERESRRSAEDEELEEEKGGAEKAPQTNSIRERAEAYTHLRSYQRRYLPQGTARAIIRESTPRYPRGSLYPP